MAAVGEPSQMVIVTILCGSKTINHLKLFKTSTTMLGIYSDLHPVDTCTLGQVEAKFSHASPWINMDVNTHTCAISTLLGYTIFRFKCNPQVCTENEDSSSRPRDAFQMLMESSTTLQRRTLPPKRKLEGTPGSSSEVYDTRQNITRKDELYNEVIQIMSSHNVDFASVAEGRYVTQLLTNALWYITNHHTVFLDASFHSDVVPVPDVWSSMQGYNDMKRKKTKAQQMTQRELNSHAEILHSLCFRPSLESSKNNRHFRDVINQLAGCLKKYKGYLESKLAQVKESQSMTTPHRQVETDIYIYDRKAKSVIQPQYNKINEAVIAVPPWEPVLLDEAKHLNQPLKTSTERANFIKYLQLQYPISLLKYAPGGSYTTVVYVWKTEEQSSTETLMTQSARITAQLKPMLPEFHTREMKKIFKQRYSHLAHLSASVMEAIYQDLTGDGSAPTNRLMQQRIQLALEGEPGIYTDLRHLNQGRPGDKFDTFWNKMEGVINEVTAADERRHGVAHFAKWISLEDLINEVKSLCPEGTPIPSKSCVRLQFAPRNPYTHRAMQFTSRFNIQYKIQVRQLRASHADAHFCAAVFRYFRQRALQLKEHTQIYCMDDKAKIPMGEPGKPISTGVRGRSSIAPTTTTSALDHDVASKSSITSSVLLKPTIPEKLEDSWYRGKVTVYVGEAVFLQANAYRSAAMMIHSALKSPEPILFRYTDGGAENRNNLIKVQLAMIATFLMLNLDMIVAARCAPGQSWQNPAERVMAILNIALQNCSTERAPCSEEMEKILKNCGSMKAIREKGKDNEDLKDAWSESVAGVTEAISERYKRLSLKGEEFDVNPPVGQGLLEEVKTTLQDKFPGIDPDTITKAQSSRNNQLVSWMKNHCRERQYCFQVAKCSDTQCCKEPKLPQEYRQWLPDPVMDKDGEHYLPLDELIGTETTDAERPSAQPAHKAKSSATNPVSVNYFMLDEIEDQKKSTTLFTAQNARGLVECVECDKQRVWFSKQALSSRQKVDVAMGMSMYEYSCGSPILAPDHPFASKVQVRLALNCGDLVELAFYKLGRVDTCSHCGGVGGVKDQDILKKFKTVLPLCKSCKDLGKKTICSRPYGK